MKTTIDLDDALLRLAKQRAAAAGEHGVHDLLTADRDFARFTAVHSQFL